MKLGTKQQRAEKPVAGWLTPISLLGFWEVFQGAWLLGPRGKFMFVLPVTDSLQPIGAYLMGWRLRGSHGPVGMQVCFL